MPKLCKKEDCLRPSGISGYCNSHKYIAYKDRDWFNKKYISDKKKEQDAKCALIKQQLLKKYNNRCQGCGQMFPNYKLELSHLTKKSQDQSLITNPKNCTIHCNGFGNKCHDIYDSDIIEFQVKLKDFERNLQILKQIDVRKYNKIKEKLNNLNK